MVGSAPTRSVPTTERWMWETSSALVEPEAAPSVTGVRCVVRPSPRPGGRSFIAAAPTRRIFWSPWPCWPKACGSVHRPGERLQGGYHPELAAGSGTARPRSGGHVAGGLPDQPSADRCLMDLCRPQGSKRGYEERERAGAIWRLQQQVHLRVLERFEYLVEDSSAGIRIEVIGEE